MIENFPDISTGNPETSFSENVSKQARRWLVGNSVIIPTTGPTEVMSVTLCDVVDDGESKDK